MCLGLRTELRKSPCTWLRERFVPAVPPHGRAWALHDYVFQRIFLSSVSARVSIFCRDCNREEKDLPQMLSLHNALAASQPPQKSSSEKEGAPPLSSLHLMDHLFPIIAHSHAKKKETERKI